ncbi:endoribonuclease xendoU domain-containing protein [Ditylenchus destructor]|uniref:Endoribonuclease xendoU domain-containing protein n=1 Tax=Ditylenchus destructor TaxID=166010 RepID=A0AAD4N4M7_9BILA|nr:endoribonuclease xendoU domain-containing protein [Ditylenchus destructor]
MDNSKARPDQIQLDYQGHTSARDPVDNAKHRLFKSVDESLLSGDTYTKLVALYDNYIPETVHHKTDVFWERQEINSFLDALLASRPLKSLRGFLQRKKIVFRDWLNQLWFGQYSRARGQPDTSGFEHVFLGEVKNGEISGMHNWIRLYYLERNSSSAFDYKGFLVKRFNIFSALKYSYGRYIKRSGSFFMGTSPEFDISVYTFCFLFRRGRDTCDFELDGCPISITAFDLIQQKKVFIGSIYPSAGRMTEQCRRLNS